MSRLDAQLHKFKSYRHIGLSRLDAFTLAWEMTK